MAPSGHRERMVAGEPYLANDPELVTARVRARVACAQFNAIAPADLAARHALLAQLLGAVGPESEIVSPFQCDYGSQIFIGARSFINFGAVILDSAVVRIGDDVQIGPGVQLVTPLHPLDPDERRTQREQSHPITIGDDVWLAAGVIVCPGVAIGDGTVVGAGSVVTRDLPARHLCVGSPCRVLRAL